MQKMKYKISKNVFYSFDFNNNLTNLMNLISRATQFFLSLLIRYT